MIYKTYSCYNCQRSVNETDLDEDWVEWKTNHFCSVDCNIEYIQSQIDIWKKFLEDVKKGVEENDKREVSGLSKDKVLNKT